MPRRNSRLWIAALCALSIISLNACQPDPPTMTPEETRAIDALTTKMTTRCVGRYLIDLPGGFIINPIHTTKLEGVDIQIEPMQRPQFEKTLQARREALGQERILGEETLSLISTTPLSDSSGYVFNRSRNGTDATIRTLELTAWRSGFRIIVSSDATDMSLDTDPMIGDTRRTDVAERLAHLLDIYQRVRGRADLEVPTESGVCFANGFLRGMPDDDDKEQIDLYYHLKSAKDVYFSFHHLSGIGSEDDTLLERAPAIEKDQKERNGQTLRKGKRESHSLRFEEWLSEMESDPGVQDYNMTLELNSKTVTATTPLFIIDLDSGVEYPRVALSLEEAAVHKPITQATFNAAQTVALWDKVTATLRPRPGAF